MLDIKKQFIVFTFPRESNDTNYSSYVPLFFYFIIVLIMQNITHLAYLPVKGFEPVNTKLINKYNQQFFPTIASKINFCLESIPNEVQFEIRCNIAYRTQYMFDYLGRTNQSPEILHEYMKTVLLECDSYRLLNVSESFNDKTIGANLETDIYKITRESFNYMWPKTTRGNDYKNSLKMVKPRVDQFISLIDRTFKPLSILDSGCGPGRYLDCLSSIYPDATFHGLDQGKDILKSNRDRFDPSRFQFHSGHVNKLPFDDNAMDLVLSVGVLHHVKDPIEQTIKEHLRVVKPGGYFFVFIVGGDGLEMSMWSFLREIMRPVPKEIAHQKFADYFVAERVQGLLDHCYGEYFLTNRDMFESLLAKYGEFQKVPGISGADVTKESMSWDSFFDERYGEGHLRYLIKKNG